MQQNVLASLQELLASSRPAPHPVFSFSLFPSGIPRGALTEISGPHGSGKTEMVLKFLAEHSKLRVAWIEEQFTAYPCSFPQLGVQLNRVLFVEAGKDLLWTTHQILRSRIFGAVIMTRKNPILGETDLRRLQLSAEQSAASLILLSEEPTTRNAWPIKLQLEVRKRGTCARTRRMPSYQNHR